MTSIELIKMSGSSNLNASTGGVKRRKKVLHSTPKKHSTQPLFDFCASNSVPTVLKKPCRSLHTIPNIQTTDERCFLFLLGTKLDTRYIQPIIIRVCDLLYQYTEFVRCRIDDTNYVGKVISISQNLNAIQSEAEKLCAKISTGFRCHIIKKDHMILCCTKDVRLFEIQADDKRREFLIDILPPMNELINEEMEYDDSNASPPEECQNGIEDAELNAHSASSIAKEIDFNAELDALICEIPTNAKSADQTSYVSTATDSGCLYDVSSGSDCEAESDTTKKKRRKRQYTDCKLLSKFREEKKHQSEKANSEIVLLLDILENSIPALPKENPITPVMKNIYQFCLHLNTKLNNMNEKNLLENSIPLTRKIKEHKVKGKDEINLNGLILPITEYAYALKTEEPRLVMSRLMRACIPEEIKDDCQVNDRADDTNFLFRIGDSCLEGNERLADGREKIEMLIEHSHAVKKLDKMSYQSYRECKAQVDKALYDYNRKKLKKKDGKDKNKRILNSEMNKNNQSDANLNSNDTESLTLNSNSINKELLHSGQESQVRYLIRNFHNSS